MFLRHLLRTWLRTAAERKVREKMTEAAQEPVRAEACELGVVFALRIEAGGLEDRLQGTVTTHGQGFVVRQGSLKGRQVALVCCGSGRESAARATAALIAGHRPPWVLSTGFAGGLCPELKRHDVLMVDHLIDTDGNRLVVDLKVDPASLTAKAGVHVGRLLTADAVVRLPEEKRALGRQYEALAVDMETFAVAEVCRAHHVPFLAVRVINDAIDDALPDDVERLLSQKTTASRLGAAAGSIWRRPGSFKDMYQLRENALLASERLGKFLSELFDQW